MFKLFRSSKSDDQSTGDKRNTSANGSQPRDGRDGKTSESARPAGCIRNTSAGRHQPRDSGSRQTSKPARDTKPGGDRRPASSNEKKPPGSTGRGKKPKTTARTHDEPRTTRPSFSTPKPPRPCPSSTEAAVCRGCDGDGYFTWLIECTVNINCRGCDVCESAPVDCSECTPGAENGSQLCVGASSAPGDPKRVDYRAYIG